MAVNDGPYKFYGLPGLILKVNDEKKLFAFEALGIDQGRKIDNSKFDEQQIDYKSKALVKELLKDYKKNPQKYWIEVISEPASLERLTQEVQTFSFLNLEID